MHSQHCVTNTTNSRIFSTPQKRNPVPMGSHSPFSPTSPASDYHQSTFSLHRCAFSRHCIWKESYNYGFLCQASFTQHNVFRVQPCHSTNLYFILFCGCMILPCMNRWKFVHPFISWWTFRLFPPFGCCEPCCYKQLCASFCVDMLSILLGIYLGMELLDHMITLHCTSWWTTSRGDRLRLVHLLTLRCYAECLLNFWALPHCDSSLELCRHIWKMK